MKPPWPYVALSLAGLLAPLVLGLELMGPVMRRLGPEGFHAVQEQRIRAYAKSLDRPKVLLVGGSSTLMAVDPVAYSAALGRPVVNHGLSVTLGAEYIARQAADLVGPGDFVVFAPEFVFFISGAAGAAGPTPNARTARRPPLPRVPWWSLVQATAQARLLLTRIENPARAALHQRIGGLHHPLQPRLNHYEPFLITAEGTFSHTRPNRFDDKRFVVHARPKPNEVRIADSPGGLALERLARVCVERGATFAVMPPARVTKPESRHDIVADIERDWLKRARELGARVLLEAGETTLDLEFGFDSDYHVNDAGAEIIRARLLPVLEKALRESQPR